ncbi:aminoglycoside phosphotransferase family protein [Streptomyces sp. CB00316]|uniref:aminoglycoside phosphotransferase family protein n=1 Tax=Streptomyces sp. CB00316 TaxID=1703932 RepID=UPI001F3EDF6B|nr:aminoglycoside phosphotransferase family protein [Streptomyces sp. CB00316]
MPPAVSRAAIALTGAPARTARRLSARSRTAVYRAGLADGRSVVIKLYAATARRNAITESAAIRAVADHVAVPTVVGYGHIPGHEATALITTDLGPLTLGSAMRSGRISEERALKDLAGLLGRLHRAPVQSFAPRRPIYEQVTSLGRRCPPSGLDRIAPALAVIADAAHTAPVWCHGDLHGDNIVIAGTRAVRHLVDFTDAAAGPRESDVAQTLVMTDALSTLRARTVTDAYPLALDHHLLAAWAVFHTTRSWAHSSPGDDRALWAGRLDHLSRRTPHLFRTSRPERTYR